MKPVLLCNIEAERARKGLTITEFAKELGVSLPTYRKYIRGIPIPSDKLLGMSRIFGCSIDYLLNQDDTAS